MADDHTSKHRLGDALPLFVGLAAVLFTLALAAILSLGRDVFVPFALAILLAFLLAPAVRILQQAGMPRAVAAIVAVTIAVAALAGLTAVIGQQVAGLASDLPRYETTIRQKIASARAFASGGGALASAVDTLKSLAEDGLASAGAASGGLVSSGAAGAAGKPPADTASRGPKPVPVEMVAGGSDPFGELGGLASPLFKPLANFGLIVVFAVFVLIQREDLRNRLIRLAGTDDLLKTTAAIDDAAYRLSRLFLTQLAINGSYGIIIGFGLWIIGVPSPILWAVLAGMLRFIPYVGATMGASLPILLAIGIDPGWSMLLWSAALFIVVDVTLGQILEPLLYGHSTGISPVAVILTTAIWTFLWGPIGLLLATPLTVCIVVLGRHVERLRFLDVLLGDRPVLSPHELLYQRMLAGDPLEAAARARTILKERALVTYYDEVALAGVRLAERDAARGSLTRERQDEVRRAFESLLAELGTAASPGAPTLESAPTNSLDVEAATALEAVGPDHEVAFVVRGPNQLKPGWRAARPVLIVAGKSLLGESVARMLLQILGRHGLGARVVGPDWFEDGVARVECEGVALVCLPLDEPGSPARVRLAARRARRRFPGTAILVGLWGADGAHDLGILRRATSADILATSFHESLTGALRLSTNDDALVERIDHAQAEGPHERWSRAASS